MLHQPIAATGHEVAPSPAARRTGARFYGALAAIWLAAATLAVLLQAHAIAERNFPDPDDYLRLGEVRDWLAGQSFWDVGQHRVNPPFGAPMHWSRIVDAPIALVELLLRPLLGTLGAETAAAIVIPLLTLGVVMLAVAIVGRRLGGSAVGLAAAALMPTAVATYVQLKPLRVDHHGWEIAFSLLALAAAIGGGRRGGLLAGAAIAIGLQISLEQLPFAVALGCVIAARWVLDPRCEPAARIAQFVLALCTIEALLFAGLHAPADWGVHCDGISPPHLLALAIVAVGVVGTVAASPTGPISRAAGLALTGAVAAIAYHAVPPHCGLDAFSQLSPFTRRYWLDYIAEGLPVWRSGLQMSVVATAFPVVGLSACAVAARAESGERRALWISYGAVLAAATLLGVLVLRAASLSNAIATVPAAWAMVRVVRRTRSSPRVAMRVFGTTAAILALGPLAPAVLALSLIPADKSDDLKAVKDLAACRNEATWQDLGRLAPSRILASIDAGPALLFNTRHAVLATGHHRAGVAIEDELRAWMGDDRTARHIIDEHGIGYVLSCPALGETKVYAKVAPHGLSARLMAGRPPAWLQPVPLPGSAMRLWRVRTQPPAGLPSSRSDGGVVPTVAQISRSAEVSPSS